MRRLRRFWFNLPIPYKGIAVISIPLLCMVAVLACLGAVRKAEGQAKESVLHSQRVHLEAKRLLGALVDAENNVRGYDLTRDRAFLKVYSDSQDAVPDSLRKLRELVGNDPEQSRRVRQLRTIAAKRLELLAANVKTVRSSGSRAAEETALTQS